MVYKELNLLQNISTKFTRKYVALLYLMSGKMCEVAISAVDFERYVNNVHMKMSLATCVNLS